MCENRVEHTWKAEKAFNLIWIFQLKSLSSLSDTVFSLFPQMQTVTGTLEMLAALLGHHKDTK